MKVQVVETRRKKIFFPQVVNRMIKVIRMNKGFDEITELDDSVLEEDEENLENEDKLENDEEQNDEESVKVEKKTKTKEDNGPKLSEEELKQKMKSSLMFMLEEQALEQMTTDSQVTEEEMTTADTEVIKEVTTEGQ